MSFSEQIVNDKPDKYKGVLQNKLLSSNIKLKLTEYNTLQNTYNSLINNEFYNRKAPSGGWDKTNNNPTSYISAGGKDWVWSVSTNNDVYTCKKPCDNNQWINISGPKLTHISGGINEVWGINTEGHIYKMNQDHSNDWVNVPGTLTNISQGGGWIWGVNSKGNVFKCKSPCNGNWVMDNDNDKDDKWVLIFRQSNNNWYWTKQNAGNRNINNPNWSNYSQLQNLEGYRGPDGKFTFKMIYPGDNRFRKPQIWKQSSNPYTVRNNRHGLVAGYEEVQVPYTKGYWGGLRWDGVKAILNGSTKTNNWWYAIGSYRPFRRNAIPGANNESVTKVELYVKSSTKSKSMLQLSCNDTYVYGIDTNYKAWFKPIDGSGSWKSFGNPITWQLNTIHATPNKVYMVGKKYRVHETDINGIQPWSLASRFDHNITGDLSSLSVDTQSDDLYVTNKSNIGYRYTPITSGGEWMNIENNDYSQGLVEFKGSNDDWKYLGQTNSIEECRLKSVQDKDTLYSSVVYTTDNGINNKTCYGGVKGGKSNSRSVAGVTTSLAPNGSSRLGGAKGEELLKQMKTIQDEIYALMKTQKIHNKKSNKKEYLISADRNELNNELKDILSKLQADRTKITKLLNEPDEIANNEDGSYRNTINYIIYVLWIIVAIISIILAIHLYYSDSEGISPITYIFVGAWTIVFISHYYTQFMYYGKYSLDNVTNYWTNNV